jgi:DNA-3-methyladenine glycosylase
MYAAGGVLYGYLCYGVHEWLNLVVGPQDWPAVVLIRGVAAASGPGRVTRALQIGRELNGVEATPAAGGLWLEDHGVHEPRSAVTATPRVGFDDAGSLGAGKRWRFIFAPEAGDGGGARPRRRRARLSRGPGRV